MNQENGHKQIQPLRNSDLIRDSRQLFIFKKTEKVVSAIFLITESFAKNVPQLSAEMRSHAMNLLKRTLEVKSFIHFEVHDVEAIIKDYLFLRSLFAVAHQTRLISDTNFSIVEFEMAGVLARLKSIIETPLSDAQSSFLSEDFFNIDEIVEEKEVTNANTNNSNHSSVQDELHKSEMSDKGHVSYKGQGKDKEDLNMSFTKAVARPAMQKESTPRSLEYATSSHNDEKEGRLDTITALLRQRGQSSIKDIYDQFSGVSEKTIQRDLLALVQKGIVIKEGEKRWSMYRIAR